LSFTVRRPAIGIRAAIALEEAGLSYTPKFVDVEPPKAGAGSKKARSQFVNLAAPIRRPTKTVGAEKAKRPCRKTSGIGPGERRLNGVQTSGHDYTNLSEPSFEIRRTNNVGIAMRDGTTLMAGLYQPDAERCFQALISFSPYPRQLQDVGAPSASSRPAPLTPLLVNQQDSV
jgi:hypothetical protein